MGTVHVDDHDQGVRVLTLERPPANAIDESLLADLAAAIEAAREDDTVRAVVLRGSGAFFSAGLDLSAPHRDSAGERRIAHLYREAHLKLLTISKPTVAMLDGHAVAGGLILVLACDYRLGLDADYRIGLNEVAVGAAFPLAAMEIVRLRLSHARAAELVLGATLYPASQAIRLGVVDELLAAERFEATARRRAARLGAFPREAYAHAKAALVGEAAARIAAETPEDAAHTSAVWRTPESRAARARQREKLGLRR